MASPRRNLARQRFQETQKNWVKPVLATSATLTIAAAVIFGMLAWKPRTVDCITTENTYCKEELVSELSGLQTIRFLFPGKALREKEAQLRALFPDLASVSIKRTPVGTLQATVTLAKPLLTCWLNGQEVVIRENGYISPSETIEGQLQVELTATVSGQQLIAPWGKQEQKNLAQLTDKLEHIRPRIKKIITSEPTKVIAFPEGNGPIFLRVDEQADIDTQLSTLQAFFRSTTMETPYQELDVRFSHLIIKE